MGFTANYRIEKHNEALAPCVTMGSVGDPVWAAFAVSERVWKSSGWLPFGYVHRRAFLRSSEFLPGFF